MRTIFSSFLLASCLLLPSLPTQAGQTPEGQTARPAEPAAASAPAQAATPAKTASPSTARSDAAEERYRAWVEKEHADDSAVFSKDKGKIEDKYKGYVRPKHDKKDAKAEPAKDKTKGD